MGMHRGERTERENIKWTLAQVWLLLMVLKGAQPLETM